MDCPTCKDLARILEARRSDYIAARSAGYYRVSTDLAAYKNVEMERASSDLEEHRLTCVDAATRSAPPLANDAPTTFPQAGGEAEGRHAERTPRGEVAAKRDFALLSREEALRIAIVVEERNAQLYHRLGEMFSKSCPDSPQIVSTFCDLADTERQHGAFLTARYCERFGGVQADITEEDIRDLIEMPALCAGDILAAAQEGDMTLARRIALEMVLATERSTVNYYARLVETTSDPELKALYKEFVGFEQEHTDRFEQELGELGHN